MRVHVGTQDVLHSRQMTLAVALGIEKVEHLGVELQMHGAGALRPSDLRLCPEFWPQALSFGRMRIMKELTALSHPFDLAERGPPHIPIVHRDLLSMP